MYKIVGLLVGLFPGMAVGAVGGAFAFSAFFSTGSHMDMSGLAGFFVGFPVGGALGALLGMFVGTWVDRAHEKRTAARLSPESIDSDPEEIEYRRRSRHALWGTTAGCVLYGMAPLIAGSALAISKTFGMVLLVMILAGPIVGLFVGLRWHRWWDRGQL